MAVVARVVAIYAPQFLAGVFAPGAAAAGATAAATATAAGASGFGATLASAGAIAGSGLGGLAVAAAGAAIGSIASQGVGLAIGAIDHFSWKDVGLAALGSIVGGVLSKYGPLQNTFKTVDGVKTMTTSTGVLVGRGMASSMITQGIGVQIGLQDKFSWGQVAAAGVMAGVSAAMADGEFLGMKVPGTVYKIPETGLLSGQHDLTHSIATGMAGTIAGAAVMSLVDGSDFGDNIISLIPQAIANTIGEAIGGEIVARGASIDYGGAGPGTGGPLPDGSWPMMLQGIGESSQGGGSGYGGLGPEADLYGPYGDEVIYEPEMSPYSSDGEGRPQATWLDTMRRVTGDPNVGYAEDFRTDVSLVRVQERFDQIQRQNVEDYFERRANEKIANSGGAVGGPNGGLLIRVADSKTRVAPGGGEFIFIGGAGVQGAYLEGFDRAFKGIGFKGVRVANADTPGDPSMMGLAADVLGVTSVNDLEFAQSLLGSGSVRAAASHSLDLNRQGKQYNLGGYSYGSAAAASMAYAVAESGGHVDNLVLVGAPINRDLYNAVMSNRNIANVITVDLASHGDPIRVGMNDFSIAATLPTLISQMPKNEGHFYYSGTGQVADQRRADLATYLYNRGVR